MVFIVFLKLKMAAQKRRCVWEENMKQNISCFFFLLHNWRNLLIDDLKWIKILEIIIRYQSRTSGFSCLKGNVANFFLHRKTFYIRFIVKFYMNIYYIYYINDIFSHNIYFSFFPCVLNCEIRFMVIHTAYIIFINIFV